MKLIKILIVSVFVLFSVNNFALAESALKQILSSGKLKAGTTGDFNPFSVRDTATNKYKGYDIDIMSELAKDMGVEIEFVPTDWKTIVNGVVAGKYHITGSASIKASRMKAAGFSESYLSVNFKPFTTNDKLSKFKNEFNEQPNHLSLLSYDLIGLIYYLSLKNDIKEIHKAFIAKNSFKGKIGVFDIEDNKINHRLNFYKIEDKKIIKIF